MRFVQELGRLVEEWITNPEWTSSLVKLLLEGIVSDRAIERALPPEKKKKYRAALSGIDDKIVLGHSTSGETHQLDGNPKELDDEFGKGVIAMEPDKDNQKTPPPVEIDLSDQSEAIRELEQQRERDRETIKTMQRQIDELQRERSRLEAQASDATTARKATQEDFEKAKERVKELEEALTKAIQESGFQSASNLVPKSSNSEVWLPAIDALNLFVHLRKDRDHAVDNHQPWRKILFDIDKDGRVSGAHLADA